MSHPNLRPFAPFSTRAADLPEELPPVTLDGPHADESDYALVYSDELLAAAMAAARAAARAAEGPQEDPDAARLTAEYAAQRRASAANADEHAPTDAEIAADPEISAILDGWRAGDIDWLAAQVEAPEHFTVAQVAA